MTTSWLDLVPAVPAVGLVFKAWYKSRDAVFASLEPFLADLEAKNQTLLFRDHGPLGLQVDTSAGYVFQFDLMNVVVAFHGDDRAAEPSGYTENLAKVQAYAADLCKHLVSGQRPLARVGVIAEGQLARDALPPGMRAWLERIAAPAGELESATARFTAKVRSGDGTVDRVHHRIKQVAEPDKPVEFKLDWQRYYDPQPEVRGKDLGKRLEEHVTAAMMYFEHFAAGKERGAP